MQKSEADEIRAAAGLTVSASKQAADVTDEVPVPILQPNNVRDIRRKMMRNEEKA